MMKHILMSFARCISHQTRGFPVLCWISLWYSSWLTNYCRWSWIFHPNKTWTCHTSLIHHLGSLYPSTIILCSTSCHHHVCQFHHRIFVCLVGCESLVEVDSQTSRQIKHVTLPWITCVKTWDLLLKWSFCIMLVVVKSWSTTGFGDVCPRMFRQNQLIQVFI